MREVFSEISLVGSLEQMTVYEQFFVHPIFFLCSFLRACKLHPSDPFIFLRALSRVTLTVSISDSKRASALFFTCARCCSTFLIARKIIALLLDEIGCGHRGLLLADSGNGLNGFRWNGFNTGYE